MNGLLLDTNVVSEMTTSPPDLDPQPESSPRKFLISSNWVGEKFTEDRTIFEMKMGL